MKNHENQDQSRFVYFRLQNEKADKIKSSLLESIYTLSKRIDKEKKSRALKELVTNGLDDESIWQQIELKNEETLQDNLKNVSQLLASSTDKFQLDLSTMQFDDENQDEHDSEEYESAEETQLAEAEGSDEDNEEEPEPEEGQNIEDDEDDDDSTDGRPMKSKTYRKTIVDDKFFKLREMEEFLQFEDQREMNPEMGDGTNVDIDMFTSDETNREESLKYSDFFDDGEPEGVEDDQEEEEDEGDNDEYQAPQDDGPKSSFELMQERLHQKIEKMENRMLDDRPWQMKGEVKADHRPQNSLLEEVLEFDSTTRPAPIITEEVTLKLEDIIKQRIKDKAFDDVERKVKPSDIRLEYKKQLVLDQEKSKQSLAQIYEKEFIKEIEKNNPDDEEPEEPKEHKEIRADLKDLFDKLDMLSNFHFTPRPAQPELKIITNLPTITMEEVAPVGVSDAAILAPEEVKRKYKGDVFGAGERTKTDKNRERRHKKVFQKDKFQKKSLGTKSITEKVMKSRNVEKVSLNNFDDLQILIKIFFVLDENR